MRFSINYELNNLENLEFLEFEGNIYKPKIRIWKEMKDLYISETKDIEENLKLYYMFRDIKWKEIEEILKKEQLRFDITVMENIKIGKEYNKTMGHYHPEAAPGRSFPEIYQILKGNALFILQEKDSLETLIINAYEKSTIIIPPNYGHVMINIGNEKLVTLNLVSSRFIPIYEPYRLKKGAIYYVLEDNLILKNTNYEIFKEPIFLIPKLKIENLFIKVKNEYQNFRFLNRPYEIDDYLSFYEKTTTNMKLL